MINLFYCTDANFGDAMSPLIVEKLSGQRTRPSGIWNADMMAVGSVFYHGGYLIGDLARNDKLKYLKAVAHICHSRMSDPIKVWGSGYLQYPRIVNPYIKRRLNVVALRGSVTRAILERFDFIKREGKIAYGDPGLLFARLFGVENEPKYDLGIIPHVGRDEKWREQLQKTYQKVGVRLLMIDASKSPEEVVKEIASCERIMSSSLHGLIVADSLGIPNIHMGLSYLGFDKSDFELKFQDYYSAFGLNMPKVIGVEDLLASPKSCMQDKNFFRLAPNLLHDVQESLLSTFPMNGC